MAWASLDEDLTPFLETKRFLIILGLIGEKKKKGPNRTQICRGDRRKSEQKTRGSKFGYSGCEHRNCRASKIRIRIREGKRNQWQIAQMIMKNLLQLCWCFSSSWLSNLSPDISSSTKRYIDLLFPSKISIFVFDNEYIVS